MSVDVIYIYYDSDDIGLKFEQAYLDSNRERLRSLSKDLLAIHNRIVDFVSQFGGVIVGSGGDEGLIKFSDPIKDEIIRGISLIWMSHGLKASVGSGNTIREAFLVAQDRKKRRRTIEPLSKMRDATN